MRELGALRRGQVWLTLATGAIGFGGLFAVYTYLSTTLLQVTGVSERVVPAVLAAFGVGMTIGNLVVPRFADRRQMATAGALLLWTAATLALYPAAAHHAWSITLDVFAVGCGAALATVLQARLMDVAGDAQASPPRSTTPPSTSPTRSARGSVARPSPPATVGRRPAGLAARSRSAASSSGPSRSGRRVRPR